MYTMLNPEVACKFLLMQEMEVAAVVNWMLI